ncbi:MAG: hypothetical protein AABY22_26560 [Nanoarchaeota archaeon]
MKKRIEKYIKRLVRWAFQDRILVYRHSQFIDELDLVQSEGDITSYIKREIVHKLAEKMFEDGVIDMEQEKNPLPDRIGDIIRSRVHILK